MVMQLIEKGLSLAKALDAKASEYHVKSDANEVISWESVGIRTRINDLEKGNFEARKDSRYKGIEWGVRLHKYCPDLSESVRKFYIEYYG